MTVCFKWGATSGLVGDPPVNPDVQCVALRRLYIAAALNPFASLPDAKRNLVRLAEVELMRGRAESEISL